MIYSVKALFTISGVTAVAVTGVSVASGVLGNADAILMYALGVCFNTFLAAFLGAVLAIGVAEPVTPRTRMWFLIAAQTVIASAAVVVAPKISFLSVLAEAPTQAVAAISGFIGRWIIPKMQETIAAFMKGLAERLLLLIGGK